MVTIGGPPKLSSLLQCLLLMIVIRTVTLANIDYCQYLGYPEKEHNLTTPYSSDNMMGEGYCRVRERKRKLIGRK